MASPLDREWLKENLAKALDWDELVVEGVVDSIVAAENSEEIDDIVANFMAECPEAQRIVTMYCEAQETSQTSMSRPVRQSNASGERHRDSQAQKTAGWPAASSTSSDRGSALKQATNPARNQTQAGSGPKQLQDGGSKKSKGKRNVEMDDPEVQRLPRDVMPRTVANCLGCGKIFDARKLTEAMYRFVESGGICDFCGTPVRLDDTDPTETKENAKAVNDSDGTEAAQKAKEFKDRLVHYDRHSAQRTTVLDDQSDYFEIETNVWLEEKEKKELRMRRELEDEMAKSLRKKVHYTIDLLGRRVFLSEEPKPSEETQAVAEAALAAAQSTSEEIPQGGGTATKLATETAARLQQRESDLQFRVPTNPDLKMASPIFLPSPAALEQSKHRKEPPRWTQGYKGRLQHDDVFADFEEDLEPAVAASDLSSYAELFENYDNGAFDLCPHTSAPTAMPLISVKKAQTVASANTRMSAMLFPTDAPSNAVTQGPDPPLLAPGDVFPDGMVLMKNWLSFEERLRTVEAVRNLGIGTGGFYTPVLQKKAQLKLKMMCLGWNWNPTNRIYEETRSNFDGVPVPELPKFLKDWTRRCVREATRLRGEPFSEMDPNVCICNFYAQNSLLGLHQDKEEGSESLRKQIPVVSFSIGATGEFVFGKTRAIESAQSVLLESGDALVFGGPSRMVFHGIRKIFPESMPPELTEITGMRNGRLNLTLRQYIPE